MNKRYLIIITFLFCIGFNLEATTQFGGKGLFYVNSANVIPKGYLESFTGIRYFGKVAGFGSDQKAYTLWNVRIVNSFNYGAGKNVEFAVTPIIYQDTNTKKGNAFNEKANFIDDVLLSMKIGSFSMLESPYVFGGMIYFRLPTAKAHNIIYEPYSAGKVEIGLNGLFSYFSNVAFPEESWSFHANLGYLNHNDVGKELTDDPSDITPESMSSELLIGIGILYPAGTFDFSTELNASYFLSRPPETAYSRESVSYLTAGLYYKPYQWLTLEMAMDLRLFSGKNLSVYSPETHLPPPPTEDFPNYPTWRGLLGVKIGILPTDLYATSTEASLKRKARDRRAILEKMMEERKDTEDAESELSKIKAERQKVEEELERLRKLLETEKDKDKK